MAEPPLEKGLTGGAVLQRALEELGYDPGEVDGDFGARRNRRFRPSSATVA